MSFTSLFYFLHPWRMAVQLHWTRGRCALPRQPDVAETADESCLPAVWLQQRRAGSAWWPGRTGYHSQLPDGRMVSHLLERVCLLCVKKDHISDISFFLSVHLCWETCGTWPTEISTVSLKPCWKPGFLLGLELLFWLTWGPPGRPHTWSTSSEQHLWCMGYQSTCGRSWGCWSPKAPLKTGCCSRILFVFKCFC